MRELGHSRWLWYDPFERCGKLEYIFIVAQPGDEVMYFEDIEESHSARCVKMRVRLKPRQSCTGVDYHLRTQPADGCVGDLDLYGEARFRP